jgi:hypothetical protein
VTKIIPKSVHLEAMIEGFDAQFPEKKKSNPLFYRFIKRCGNDLRKYYYFFKPVYNIRDGRKFIDDRNVVE